MPQKGKQRSGQIFWEVSLAYKHPNSIILWLHLTYHVLLCLTEQAKEQPVRVCSKNHSAKWVSR